jgi:hypothetical protein
LTVFVETVSLAIVVAVLSVADATMVATLHALRTIADVALQLLLLLLHAVVVLILRSCTANLS